MLSVNLIQRHFEAGRFDALLDGVAANGLDMPLPLRARLSQTPVAAIALGLRRVVELTYGPTAVGRLMIARLLAMQQPDGSFAHDPLPTAAALAAIGRVLRDQTSLPRDERQALEQARHQALAALGAMQADDSLFSHPDDRTVQDRALATAFILALLAHDEAFRSGGAVRFADVMTWFESRQRRLADDATRLWLIARMDATTATPPAIAA